MNTPTISVIIPTYNRAALLERAILSTFKQTNRSFEIVISDNCSTDNTENIINKLQTQSPVPFVYSKNSKNLGMAGNWDHALKNIARGSHAIIMSDDDYFVDPEYLDKAVAMIKKHKPCLVFSRCSIVDSDTQIELLNQSQSQHSTQLTPILTAKEILSAWGRYGSGPGLGFAIMLQTAIFDRNIVIEKLGGFSQNILSIDYKTWWGLMTLNLPICFVDTVGAAYAVHPCNETKRHPPSIEQLIENFDCFLGPKLTSNPTLDIAFVDAQLKRILHDCLSSFPGHYVSVYSFLEVYKKLKKKDKRLSQGLLSFLIKPRYLAKILLTTIPGLFPYLSKITQRSKIKKALQETAFAKNIPIGS